MLNEFNNKTAVITGAGSGFGREFALIGARRGMNLVLADVQTDALAQTEAMVRDLGADVLAEKVDVSEADQVQHLAARTIDQFGPVHLLFNNAGVALGGLIWEHTPADWQWVLGVNLIGVANGIHAFVPAMIESGQQAHIVNTASVAGLLSVTNMAVYNVSKHGVVTLSETLYHDLKMVKAPIGVSVLCPAFVPTGIFESERNRPAAMQAIAPKTDSMMAADAASTKAVQSGKISAADVAQMTYDAVESDRFYIVTHPRIMTSVRARCEDIAQLRNPTDPYASRADVAPKASG